MSIPSAHARAPFASAAASDPAGPPRVSTLRLWILSECVSRRAAPVANAAEIRAIAARSRPSEKFGTASIERSDEELAAADDGLAVDLERGLHHHAVEMNRDLDGAADASRRAERHMHGAQDLLRLEQLVAQDRLLVG